MTTSKCGHRFWNRYENSKTGERFNICPICGLRIELTPLNTLRNSHSEHKNTSVEVTRLSHYVSVV